MKWYVDGGKQPFTVAITDKRTDLIKSQLADIEVKLSTGEELRLEEELRYSNSGLLIRRFEHERCVKENAITAYLKDKLFQAYSQVGLYTHLLEFIQEILVFPYRRCLSQDADYRKTFKLFDVYTATVPKEYRGNFVIELLSSDVEEALNKDPLLQFAGSFVLDWGFDIAKQVAVQYYVQYIGRQIIDHERPILGGDEYINTPSATIINWLTGPH